MMNTSMIDTLGEYVQTRSPEAFRCLVMAHIDAVHSQCLRQLRDPAAAEDVTQQVFILLAQKAAKLPSGVVLGGWLFTTARYCCSTHLRSAARRRSAESKAANMRNELIEPSTDGDDFSGQAEPILDDALAHLAPRDRDALLLRFFQGRTLREVGESIGVSEDAAKKRVSRALDKLRNYFARRGVVAPSTAIATFLGSAIKPASPQVAQAAIQAATVHSVAAAGHVAGLLSKSAWSLPKIAAGFALAGALTAGVVVVGHNISAQTPPSVSPPPTLIAAADAPMAQPSAVPATQANEQSTPLGTLNKLCAAMETGDDAAIEECLCDDGKDPAGAELARNFLKATGSAYRLEILWKKKFGSDMRVSGLNFDMFPGGTLEILFQETANVPGGPEVTVDGDVAKMRIPGPAEKFFGNGPDRIKAMGRWAGAMFVFDRVDGEWKLNTDRTFSFIVNVSRIAGNTTDATEVSNTIVQGVSDTLNEVAGKIENGAITTKTQGVSAIGTQIAKVFRDAGTRGSSYMVLPVIGGE